MTQPSIAVVGGLVLDLVVWLPHFPRQGETLHPTRFATYCGGKGFNQALTARRCGAAVNLVGRTGDDPFADLFFTALAHAGIDTRFVTRDAASGTSLAVPMINPQGDNSIIGIPRANTRLTPADVDAAHATIAAAHSLLLQLEVPVAASRRAAEIARAAGAQVILNPAPAHTSIADLIAAGLVDWLIPNQTEAEMLTGHPVKDQAAARQAAQQLLERGIRQGVIVTLGAQGALAVTPTGDWFAPPFHITPVDPTGAGDAFCGALAVALAEGQPLGQALRFANAAGAHSATLAGAEPSLPHRADVERLLHTSG
jgi:ribokinase